MLTYSENLKKYLNATYKAPFADGKPSDKPLYTATYFLKRIKSDFGYVYAICEQSMSDEDLAFDKGRFTQRILPILSEKDAKNISKADLTIIVGNNVGDANIKPKDPAPEKGSDPKPAPTV